MRGLPVALLLAVIVATPELAAQQAKRGTPDEAKAMLAQAVAHYNKVGRDKALADFTAQKQRFHDRDLYVFCLGDNGKISAHGAQKKYVGTSSDALRDADGKPLGKAIVDAASSKGKGTVEYTWLNPMTQQPEPKVSFVQKVGQDVCGVGAYRPE